MQLLSLNIGTKLTTSQFILKKNRNPLITIVTVSYNAAELIEKTIRSVINQSYANKEYVVIDGASTDGTQQIIKKFITSIDFYQSEPDNGIYAAMNKAVSKATGSWVIFMNAGDLFVDNEVLEKTALSLSHTTEVLYGDILINEKGELVRKQSPEKISRIHRMPFCHQAVFTQTSLLKKYPFDEKYKLSADFKLYKQLILEGVYFEKTALPITIYDRTGLSNSQRTQGLAENIAIIKELDNAKEKLRLLPRLYLVKNWNWLRQTFKNR